MVTFALVHGAWHGAWCWDALVAELETRGHRAITMDLPCDDPAAHVTDYAAAVEASLAGAGDVVLVAHSLAGLTAPLVASGGSVRHLVFLCAVLPEPGRSFAEQIGEYPEMLHADRTVGTEGDERGCRRWVDQAAARERMYADCTDEDVQRAFDRLRPAVDNPLPRHGAGRRDARHAALVHRVR